jgi:hypothetical protein
MKLGPLTLQQILIHFDTLNSSIDFFVQCLKVFQSISCLINLAFHQFFCDLLVCCPRTLFQKSLQFSLC